MADFNAVLISLCEHFKYHIKPHDLTTGQYAEMIKRVKEYALQQEAMQKK
jgi:hypothetical protein